MTNKIMTYEEFRESIPVKIVGQDTLDISYAEHANTLNITLTEEALNGLKDDHQLNIHAEYKRYLKENNVTM